jgi:hypothetical protein
LAKETDPANRKALEARKKALEKQMASKADEIRDTAKSLKKAKQATNTLRSKVTGKVQRAMAKAMATKTAQFVARILVKAIPIVNIISTLIDIVDILKALLSDYEEDGGADSGDDESGTDEGTASDQKPGETASKPGTKPGQPVPGGQPGPGAPSKPRGPAGPQGPDGPPTDGQPPKGPDVAQKPGTEGPASDKTNKSGSGQKDPDQASKDPLVVLMRDLPDNVISEWFAFNGNQFAVTQAFKNWGKKNVGESGKQHPNGLFIRGVWVPDMTPDGKSSDETIKITFTYRIDKLARHRAHKLTLGNRNGKVYVEARTSTLKLEELPDLPKRGE